jgi:hypothetical protein
MGTPGNSSRSLLLVLELFKAGRHLPIAAIEKIIAADGSVDDPLIGVLRSRAVDDDTWGPLWALVALGERRTGRAIPAILECLDRGHEVLRDGVEAALLRMGTHAQGAVLRYLQAHEGTPARLHLMSVLAHLGTDRAVEYLLDQFRPESKDFVAIAWLLAESGHPRALKALETAVQEFPTEPGLKDPLESLKRGEPLANPLLGNWREQWIWKDDAPEEPTPSVSQESAPEAEPARPVKESCEFAPRAYDLECPACRSRLEFDSHTGDARVVKPGLTAPRNGPCPCGSHVKFKKCCGRKDESPRTRGSSASGDKAGG